MDADSARSILGAREKSCKMRKSPSHKNSEVRLEVHQAFIPLCIEVDNIGEEMAYDEPDVDVIRKSAQKIIDYAQAMRRATE